MIPTTASAPSELEALTQFLYMAPIGLVQATIDGEIVMINPMSAQLLMPLSRDGDLANLFEALGDICPDLRHRAQSYPDPHGKVCDDLHLQIHTGASKRGGPQTLSLTLLKLDSMRLMAVLSDVSLAVQRERALRQSQAWIDTIVAGITDYALTSLDRDGRVRCWNASVGRVTGFAAEPSIGRPYSLFYPEGALSGARVLDRMHEARRDGWSLDEGWLLRADGTRFWGSCLIAPLDLVEEPRPGEPAFSLIIRDISERKGAHDALHQSVSCDHLTGLVNRRAFFEAANFELQRWQRMPRPLSLVLIDADHFKAINDTHGHAAGDTVLRQLAVAMGETFRGMDVIARVGGEEFAILLPGTDGEGARAVAARLGQLIEAQTVEVDGASIRYTVSAGTAAMEPGVDSIEDLMKRADTALYAAKTNGRNRVVCWTDDLANGTGMLAPGTHATPLPPKVEPLRRNVTMSAPNWLRSVSICPKTPTFIPPPGVMLLSASSSSSLSGKSTNV
ncbi:MAG: GGDEF domain-containing protein [Rhizobiales bacterium]|nr:GGDEF domain-containing protein [Rhizobacter sp.]